MTTSLFVCLHNGGRSQMSAALFEQAAAGRHHALSAGTTPAERVHPEVVEVMRELGIDLADRRPQLLTRELAEQADVVVRRRGAGEPRAAVLRTDRTADAAVDGSPTSDPSARSLVIGRVEGSVPIEQIAPHDDRAVDNWAQTGP